MADRVALITGASSGLGAAAARRLAQEPGWAIILVARRAERLEALAGELPGAEPLALDLLDEAAPAAAAAHLREGHGGRLHLLVNNAGTGGRGSFADGGAARAGRIGRPKAGAYSASKAALAVWSDSLRAEEHAHGVHVGIVMPGFIPTEGFPQRELAAKRRTRWMLGTPEQAAEAIVEAGLGRRAERYVPRFYGALAALRTVAPGLVRRALASERAEV